MGDDSRCRIIANCEDEYAVWPADARVPPSWRTLPIVGVREQCLMFIRLMNEASSRLTRRVVEQGRMRP
jgi:uncharacterized protein YbdZ (MbtH family)